MRENYRAGGYGYGHAKQALFELICEKFKHERARYNYLIAHPEEIEASLKIGAKRARIDAKQVLSRVRSKVGY
jgi:tryptophanyl-tRNA synthetase